jgi:hypothetical protein
MNDLKAIELLIQRCAEGKTYANGKPIKAFTACRIAAAHISRFSDVFIQPTQLDQWRARGCVAAHKRMAFLLAFNDLPGEPKLPLTWLATPAQRHNGGQTNGRKSERAAKPRKGKKKTRPARGGRTRSQLGASAA